MSADPFPGPPGDAEELDSSPALPAAEADDGSEVAEQGLYVCLPAEQLTLAGFAQDGEADTMAPGPLLASVVYAVTGEDGAGLGGCSDDQLVGIISAAQRMESRAAWTRMAAMREFAARRPAVKGPGGSRAEFAADELAGELHLTSLSAAEQIDFACVVARRLPQPFAALAAGRIHPVHVRIVEDETRVLSAEHAANADEILAVAAPGMTFGELRYAAHKLVLTLDPEAVRKRKEAARQETHVRGSGRTPGTPAWWPGSCRRLRSSPAGSMSSSGRLTCVPPECPAPCASCACRPTWTCCRNATAAIS